MAGSWRSSEDVRKVWVGGALNLNVHFHALVVDGIFVTDDRGGLPFHRTPRLTTVEVAAVLHLVTQRVERLRERHGLGRTSYGNRSASNS